MPAALGLNHVNLNSASLVATRAFYELLGLEVGPRPDFGNEGIWLYAQGRPVVHVNLVSEQKIREAGPGVVDHFAFDMDGSHLALVRQFAKGDIKCDVRPKVPGNSRRQVFLKGPSGENVELNFTR